MNMKQNGKIKENAGPVDKLISVITYIVFALFSLICIYPFYYIFINTISANDLSEKGKIIFWPQQIHFRNYLDATKIPGLLQAAQISIARTLIGTACTVLLAGFLGYRTARTSKRCTSTLSLSDVAALGAGDTPFTLRHSGSTATFTVGGADHSALLR